MEKNDMKVRLVIWQINTYHISFANPILGANFFVREQNFWNWFLSDCDIKNWDLLCKEIAEKLGLCIKFTDWSDY